jgi:hypothetical protein
MKYLLVLSLLLHSPVHARTASSAERESCQAKIQKQLDTIDARMRAGYSAKEGEALKTRRRKLEDARERCRFR